MGSSSNNNNNDADADDETTTRVKRYRNSRHFHDHLLSGADSRGARGSPVRIVTCYASSSERAPDAFKRAAYALGAAIARRGWVQLNGGGRYGLMGRLTDGAVDAGGEVDAVILDIFTERNCHPRLRGVRVAEDMVERKRGLYREADAYVALPGGLGTLEELAEVMSWRQLSFHVKPIVLFNVDGYWDALVQWLDSAARLGMTSGSFARAFRCVDTAEAVVDAIASFETVTAMEEDKTALAGVDAGGHRRLEDEFYGSAARPTTETPTDAAAAAAAGADWTTMSREIRDAAHGDRRLEQRTGGWLVDGKSDADSGAHENGVRK